MSANMHKHKPPISATVPIIRDNAEKICFVCIFLDLIRMAKTTIKESEKIHIALLKNEKYGERKYEIMSRLRCCFVTGYFEEVCRMD